MERVVVDCSTGEVTIEPLTSEEIQTREAEIAAAVVSEQEAISAQADLDKKHARLNELKAKGWTSLSTTERTEASSLMLEMA